MQIEPSDYWTVEPNIIIKKLAPQSVTFNLNGNIVKFRESKPIVKGETVYLPAGEILPLLNIHKTNESSRGFSYTYGGIKYDILVNDKTINVNGRPSHIKIISPKVGNEVYLPFELFTDIMKVCCSWNKNHLLLNMITEFKLNDLKSKVSEDGKKIIIETSSTFQEKYLQLVRSAIYKKLIFLSLFLQGNLMYYVNYHI